MVDVERIARLRPAQRRLLARRLAEHGAAVDAPGGERLVAYILAAAGEPPDPAALRRYVAEALPDYMIPAWLILLDAWPRTVAGKVDRSALRDVARRAASAASAGPRAYVPPRDDVERVITAIWRELLGVASVGVDHNFFDLGGHSLLLVRLQSRLRTALGVELTIVDLFRHPTVAALADAVRARRGPGTTPAPVAGAQDRARKQRAALEQRARASTERDQP